METILVFTDFSYAAFNAARYAVNLASQLQASEVIFYHAFNPATIDTPPPFASEIDDSWGQAVERLNELKTSLEVFAGGNTKLKVKIGRESLCDAVNIISVEKPVGLVVMGSTGNNKLKRLFIGGNTMSLSDNCPAPLIIIPPNTWFNRVQKAVFVCDLQNTSEIPVFTIKSFLAQLQAKLSIVCIGAEKGQSDTISKQKKALLQPVNSIDVNSSFVHDDDAIDDIVNLSAQDAQLIIVIYKKQRFLQNIFHPGSPNRLAYYSNFPLLILRPIDVRNDTRESILEKAARD